MHHTRWMIRRDLPRVIAIDTACFTPERRWSEEDFRAMLRQRNVIGQVACPGEGSPGNEVETPDAFIVYRLHRRAIEIHSLAVDPLAQRTGVGRLILEKMKHKLTQQNRRELIVNVHEGNLPAQWFFRAMGFKATCILRNHYHDADAYEMRFALPSEVNTRRLKSLEH